MQRIPFGVCGLGRIGKQHCHVFKADSDRYELVALCDIDAERVHTKAAHLGGRAYTDFASFLADPRMELVIISTPSLDHADNARQALIAGKTVLLEKPIGVTAADYLLLQQLVGQYPGKLYFCHNHRFEPAFEIARSIVTSGVLGHLQVIKLCKHHSFMRRNDWQMRLDCGGGQLSVWGPHLIDQGLQLLGSPVREVHSYLRRVLTPGDGDDHVKIVLTGENGTVAELEISNSVALPAPYCTLYGDRGALRYSQEQRSIDLRYLHPEFCWPNAVANADTPQPGSTLNADGDLPWIDETRPVLPETSLWVQVEIELARHLYSALREGIPFPVTSADALEVVRVTEIVKQQNSQFNWIG